MRRIIMAFFLLVLFSSSAFADQASCNDDALNNLKACLQTSSGRSACQAAFYTEVAMCLAQAGQGN